MRGFARYIGLTTSFVAKGWDFDVLQFEYILFDC